MTTIFCKTTNKGEQSFYIDSDRSLYYLFSQKFRSSNKDYFERGIRLDKVYDFSHVHSAATIATLEKLQKYIILMEKQEGLVVRKQTERKYFGCKTLPCKMKRVSYDTIEEF